MKLPLHRPVLGDAEAAAVADVLASGHLVQGPRVRAFEAGLAERLGVAHAVAVSSGTAALHLSVAALDLGSGEEVVVPEFGYPATANVVELAGGRVAAADVDEDTFALTAATVEAAASGRTVGVIAVHPFGIPAPLQALTALCEARGWWLIEDAACALGTAVSVGSGPAAQADRRWADGRWPTCLSFHPRKTLTTAEGGAVVTDDAALAARVRILRNQGVDEAIAGFDRFAAAGFNYRMSDVHAAIGVVQLGRLDGIVAARRRVVGWYREALAPLMERAWVRWPRGYDAPELAMQSLVVDLADGPARDEVMSGLGQRGIGATLGGYALASQPYYRRRYGRDPAETPVAAGLYRRSLTLPVTEAMTREDVATVCAALGEVMEEVA